MTAYVNCGAIDGRGLRIPTKKALKEAVKRAAAAIDAGDAQGDDFVVFDQTAIMMSDRVPGDCTVMDLAKAPAGTELQIVGPDPYRRRNWYATVKLDRTGRVVCV